MFKFNAQLYAPMQSRYEVTGCCTKVWRSSWHKWSGLVQS